jgi:hypothetical protein
MKHTEEEIIEIAKRVLKEIDWDYDPQKRIGAVAHPLEEYLEDFKNVKIFEEVKHLIRADWAVSFRFEKEMDLPERMNTFFLRIDDETGEPFELSHEQARLKLVKSEDGKYSITNSKF